MIIGESALLLNIPLTWTFQKNHAVGVAHQEKNRRERERGLREKERGRERERQREINIFGIRIPDKLFQSYFQGK